MGIVDEYIRANINRPVTHMARELGIGSKLVMRLIRQKGYSEFKMPYSPGEEISALTNLIEVRKTGWAVEVAKERIKKLIKLKNMEL